MKVAIYSGTIPAPVFIESLIQSLAEQGVSVYLFGRKTSSENYNNRGNRVFLTPSHGILRIGFVLIQIVRLLVTTPGRYIRLFIHYRKISKNDSIRFINWWCKVLPVVNHLPDIFHIQWAKALPNWFFLKDLFGVKIVLSLRGAHINYSPLANEYLAIQYRELFPKVDYFQAVSRAIVNEAGKYGAEEKRIKVIYSGAHTELLQYYRKKDWKSDNPFRFISVGRFHWKKGYHFALSAISALVAGDIPVHYTIITQDQPTEEILYQINDLTLQDHVMLRHPTNQEEVYNKMSLSDCLLLPSVEEGIANVVLEAMAIGLPVISSDCGGMKEVIEHKKNGFLFHKRDVNHLSQMMLDMINRDPIERKLMADRARTIIEKNCDLSRLGSEMKELYCSLEFA